MHTSVYDGPTLPDCQASIGVHCGSQVAHVVDHDVHLAKTGSRDVYLANEVSTVHLLSACS